jgi:hypothetical protein
MRFDDMRAEEPWPFGVVESGTKSQIVEPLIDDAVKLAEDHSSPSEN